MTKKGKFMSAEQRSQAARRANREKYMNLNRMWMAHRLEEISFEMELTPEALAKAAGVGAGTAKKWLSGAVLPSLESIDLLCRNLDIGLADFYNYRPVRDEYALQKRKEFGSALEQLLNYPLEIFLPDKK